MGQEWILSRVPVWFICPTGEPETTGLEPELRGEWLEGRSLGTWVLVFSQPRWNEEPLLESRDIYLPSFALKTPWGR